MSTYLTINGWTKERMKTAILAGNKGERALDGDVCRYLTDDGNKCAVGCFIPEGHPGQMEGGDVGDLLSRHGSLQDELPLSLDALMHLQKVHDRSYGKDPRPALLAWVDQYVTDGEVK